jgi:5-methyltetrahydropteroyltriglutamate--homocysteine methyltransferase
MRAEAVGSLIRPRHLVGARRAVQQGTISAAEFKEIEDRAVDQAIALQEGAGLHALTDGETRRGIFTGPLTESVEGLEHVPGVKIIWYSDDGPIEEDLWRVVTGTLRLGRSSVTEESATPRPHACSCAGPGNTPPPRTRTRSR